MTEERRERIMRGVLRTIKLRRKRRTRKQIMEDPLDLKRVDFTREPGLTNGRSRVRDLRGAKAPGERGIWLMAGGDARFVPESRRREAIAEEERLRRLSRPPRVVILDEPTDRLPHRLF